MLSLSVRLKKRLRKGIEDNRPTSKSVTLVSVPSGGLARIIQACTSDTVSFTLLRFLSHNCTLVLVINAPCSASSEIAHSCIACAVVERLNWGFHKNNHNTRKRRLPLLRKLRGNANMKGPERSKMPA